MKILLGGYYGAGNLGDELLLGQLVSWLKEAGHDLTVVTLDPSHTTAQHDCMVVDREDLPTLVRQFAEADAFILGGGGLFQDHHRFTIEDLHAYPAAGISYYAQLCLLARQAGIPYLLFAMGVGPLRTGDAQEVTREIFQHAAHASVRDRASAALLRKIGVTTDLVVGADPGWLLPSPAPIDLRQRFPALAGRHVAVVVPREWPFAEGWRQSLAEGLAVLDSAGWGILWLPFQASKHGSDIGVVDALARQIDQQTPPVIAHCSTPAEAARIIASADAMVAMRLHALILGLRSQIPTLAVEYDEKLSAVADSFRLADYLRLQLTDPPSRYREGMAALIDTHAGPMPANKQCLAVMEDAARSTRESLLGALRRLPGHAARPNNWRDPRHDWITTWTARRLARDEQRIEELESANVRLASLLDGIHRSIGWQMLAPFRAMARAMEILRTQGWAVLLQKLHRAAYFRLARPLLKNLARRRLQAILSAHAGNTPIIFPPIVPWNLHLFQRPHHLARELSARGYLYFFCVPTSIHDRVLTFEEVAPRCFITPYMDLVEALPGKILHLYSTDNIYPLEWVRNRLKQGDRALYEYVDEIHEDISGRSIPQGVLDRHQYLLRNEDVVCVATADKLYREVRAVRSQHCALVTNGVDIAHFSVSRHQRSVPAVLASSVSAGKPIIGYFGALAKWFDYELVCKIAELRPGFEIVLIGPDYDGSVRWLELHKPPNLAFLGPVDYKQLPGYACWFDVSMIPFRINEITESTSPIKLFEYMALGHPIVTTDMPECRKYKSVLIGKSVAHFIEQLDHALGLREDSAYLQILREEAKDNSWAAKAEAIDGLLAGRIA